MVLESAPGSLTAKQTSDFRRILMNRINGKIISGRMSSRPAQLSCVLVASIKRHRLFVRCFLAGYCWLFSAYAVDWQKSVSMIPLVTIKSAFMSNHLMIYRWWLYRSLAAIGCPLCVYTQERQFRELSSSLNTRSERFMGKTCAFIIHFGRLSVDRLFVSRRCCRWWQTHVPP